MKKDNILLKANLMICMVIALGYLLIAGLSYRVHYNSSLQNIERITALTARDISSQIDLFTSQLIDASRSMTNDSLLRRVLLNELRLKDDPEYVGTIQEYLAELEEAYGYEPAFLVSRATSRYYTSNGVDRVLDPEDPENIWYEDFMYGDEECSVNVDNNEVQGAGNAITAFVNCKLRDEGGRLLAVVGMGVRLDKVQALLLRYERSNDSVICLADRDGRVLLSTTNSDIDSTTTLRDEFVSQEEYDQIVSWYDENEPMGFWSTDENGKNYIVVRYLPSVRCRLVVRKDTDDMMAELHNYMFWLLLVSVVLLGAILLVSTLEVRNFKSKIQTLTRAYEQERHALFKKATGQMFENIFEFDITNNCSVDETAEDYFTRMGVPAGTPYDQSLQFVAEKRVEPSYRQRYLDTFAPDHVTEAFRQGRESLSCDLRLSSDGEHYCWTRITARLILQERDNSLHMLVYQRNIDEEKRREEQMRQMALTDGLTGFLNKTATQRAIQEILEQNPEGGYAFFILDIDRFKEANDLHGHAFGDDVIRAFAASIRRCFRPDDVLGRVGGDEFAIFAAVPEDGWVERRAADLNHSLDRTYTDGFRRWKMSASIGVALAPCHGTSFTELYQNADYALYETKRRGRNGYTLYHGQKA